MKKANDLREAISITHNTVLKTIAEHIERIKGIIKTNLQEGEDGEYSHINLHNPVLYQSIDDQLSEVIGGVSLTNTKAIIDDNSNEYEMELVDINTNTLIEIVSELEGFETFEDIEMQLM